MADEKRNWFLRHPVLSTLIALPLAFILVCIIVGVWQGVKEGISEPNSFELKFYVNETGERLNGEIVAGSISYGFTKNGKIAIPKENLTIDSFTFKTAYNHHNFSFDYDFSADYLAYKDWNFYVLEEQLKDRQIYLIFSDNKTGCLLDGEVFSNEELFGRTINGLLLLREQDKSKLSPNSNISIRGITGPCFIQDRDLPFESKWIIYSLQELFDKGLNISFSAQINPRSPATAYTHKGFIRPNETAEFVKGVILPAEKSLVEKLEIISNYLNSGFNYIEDYDLLGQLDYWETPKEFLASKKGDCEDWTNTFLSSILSFDSTLKCYNLRLSSHLTAFCYLGDYSYAFLDQQNIRLSAKLDGKGFNNDELVNMRRLMNRYLDVYGISANENSIIAAYNDKEFIQFSDNEEFVKWALKFSYPDANIS